MKIGVCASPDQISVLSALDYDFYEINISWLAGLSDAEYREQTALVEKCSLAAEAGDCFFPGGFQLYAPDGNQDDCLRNVAEFAHRGLSRNAAWGGKIAVIGSGGARSFPAGMTWTEAEVQFSRVLSVCGEVAAHYGMEIVVEPLSRCDCNFIHTLAEGAAVVRMTDHAAVSLLADTFHMHRNGDDIGAIPAYADILRHFHYARWDDRDGPRAEDEEEIRRVTELLRRCPGVERVCLECLWSTDFETAVTAARPHMELFRRG